MAVERGTLAQQAYAAIRADIVANHFAPGSKLVVRVLTERLDLSATPVKAALAALEREGFIINVPHRGYFVPEISRKDMHEIYELREVIEGIAGRNAASSSDRTALSDRLEDLLRRQRSAIQRGWQAEYVDLDLEFHRAIWHAAVNGRLLQSAENLIGQVRFGSGGSSRLPGRLSVALEEHAAIIDAIAAGDAARAERECRAHVRLAAEAFERYYASDSESADGRGTG